MEELPSAMTEPHILSTCIVITSVMRVDHECPDSSIPLQLQSCVMIDSNEELILYGRICVVGFWESEIIECPQAVYCLAVTCHHTTRIAGIESPIFFPIVRQAISIDIRIEGIALTVSIDV